MNRSPNVRANAIRLKRQEHEESFLVVEGRDDRLFFEQFVSSLLGDPGCGGGVSDADLDHMEGVRPASDNML